MQRYLFIVILLLTGISRPLIAQWDKDSPPPLKERFYFGGNFSLNFGTVTFIEAAPLAGFRFTPRFSSGLGLNYSYYKDKRFYTYDTHIYGGSVFSRYRIIQDLNNVIPLGYNASVIGHVEYEALSLESQYFDYMNLFEDQTRFISHAVWVGGGMGFPMGERSSFNIFVLWNLNEDSNSFQTSPLIRVGFRF